MEIKLAANRRNKDFGIITWPYKLDFEIKTLLSLGKKFNVEFNGENLGNRVVSYKYRRFAIGKKRIQDLGDIKYFILSKNTKGLVIKVE